MEIITLVAFYVIGNRIGCFLGVLLINYWLAPRWARKWGYKPRYVRFAPFTIAGFVSA